MSKQTQSSHPKKFRQCNSCSRQVRVRLDGKPVWHRGYLRKWCTASPKHKARRPHTVVKLEDLRADD